MNLPCTSPNHAERYRATIFTSETLDSPSADEVHKEIIDMGSNLTLSSYHDSFAYEPILSQERIQWWYDVDTYLSELRSPTYNLTWLESCRALHTDETTPDACHQTSLFNVLQPPFYHWEHQLNSRLTFPLTHELRTVFPSTHTRWLNTPLVYTSWASDHRSPYIQDWEAGAAKALEILSDNRLYSILYINADPQLYTLKKQGGQLGVALLYRLWSQSRSMPLLVRILNGGFI